MNIGKNEPLAFCPTLVYHSGEKKYTAAIERIIGIENKIAIGKPRFILLPKLLYSNLTMFQ